MKKHSHLHGVLQNSSAPLGTEALLTLRDVPRNSDCSHLVISRVTFSTQTLQFGLGALTSVQVHTLGRKDKQQFSRESRVKCLMTIKEKGEISECGASGLPT